MTCATENDRKMTKRPQRVNAFLQDANGLKGST